MIDRRAQAHWQGNLREGRGTIRLGSGAFEGPYSFGTRFEGAKGTNPEELLGAAHAGCFSMALALMLSNAGHPPASLETLATVHLDKIGDHFAITGIDLTTKGGVPGLAAEEFTRWAEQAKQNCIVSKALAGVPMRLRAELTT